MFRVGVAVVVLIGAGVLLAAPDPLSPDPQIPRPIPARESLFTEDLTWMEIRDAMKAGADTILIATGGVEQNGPYLVTGKHNVVLRGTTEAIARRLGRTLIAPIVPFVPEGDFDPPTQHMKYPGTISLTADTYERLLTDICTSFRVSGFKYIVLIGDSGGNQDGMQKVAAQLDAKWKGGPTSVHFIRDYYSYDKVAKFLEDHGIQQQSEGLHDDFAMTAMMLAIDPHSARMKERIAADKFRINGVDLAPLEKTVALGKKIIDFRADLTVAAIRKSIQR